MVLESGRTILNRFFPDDFSRHGIRNLWKACPNQMLWEAIQGTDAEILSPPGGLAAAEAMPLCIPFPGASPIALPGCRPCIRPCGDFGTD